MQQKQRFGVIRNEYNKQLVQKLQEECLLTVNQYFKLLGMNFTWDNFNQYIDTYTNQNQNGNHYFQKLNNKIIFKKNEQYEFYQAKTKTDDSIQNEYIRYDDRLYALARVTYGYLAEKLNEIYKAMSKEQDLIIEEENFLEMCQNYMIALKSDRVYQSEKDIIWKEWYVYWQTKNHPIFCYSNCPGSCSPQCSGGTCYYYFPQNEINYPQLPDNERADARNFFDDDLFLLASLYNQYVNSDC